MTWKFLIRNIAGDVKAFVDDLMASYVDEEHSWQIGCQVAANLQYLGIKDAPRKTRSPGRDIGNYWAGSIQSTDVAKITQ